MFFGPCRRAPVLSFPVTRCLWFSFVSFSTNRAGLLAGLLGGLLAGLLPDALANRARLLRVAVGRRKGRQEKQRDADGARNHSPAAPRWSARDLAWPRLIKPYLGNMWAVLIQH